MPVLTVASWNLEWMNDWFAADSQVAAFKPTFSDRDIPNHQNNTQATAQRVASVIRAINPDVLAVQEAPSRLAELQLFVNQFLVTPSHQPRYTAFLGSTGAQQKVGLLVKTSLPATRLSDQQIDALLAPWHADIDGNSVLDIEDYTFTRSPLVVDVMLSGSVVRFIVMHTKSNFINRGRELWQNLSTRQQYITTALIDRRRISTEAMRTRTYLDALLGGDASTRVVVMGDLNDGPGMDYFEENYLSHNCLDILVGSAFDPERSFAAAAHDEPAASRFTAIFDDFVSGENNKHVLLDHVLLAPGLMNGGPVHKVRNSGRVRHAEYEAQLVQADGPRELRPSDHRPLSVQLRY